MRQLIFTVALVSAASPALADVCDGGMSWPWDPIKFGPDTCREIRVLLTPPLPGSREHLDRMLEQAGIREPRRNRNSTLDALPGYGGSDSKVGHIGDSTR